MAFELFEPTPLQNVKVLDLSRYQAGPKAAMVLADLGAEVVRAENPEGSATAASRGRPIRGTASTTPSTTAGRRASA